MLFMRYGEFEIRPPQIGGGGTAPSTRSYFSIRPSARASPALWWTTFRGTSIFLPGRQPAHQAVMEKKGVDYREAIEIILRKEI